MSLYWPPDANDIVTDQPRLHALVIGVGEYHHLGLGVAKPATFLNGLAPLTITAPAARRVARWLEEDYENPNRKLGSIELLLSPAEKLVRSDGGSVDVEDATMANIEEAFKRWYARCDQNTDTIAFLYFAGHGISTVSQFLLPSDFGNPDEPNEWENCIDATGLQAGMLKCAADTQLFFFDACRDTDVSALTQNNPQGKHLVSSSLSDSVDLSVAFKAASEGRKAYGRDGEETFFCKALMMCLNGVAARKSGPEWKVDTAVLASAMASVVDILGKIENLPLSCDCPAIKPVVLHVPKEPKVLVKVDCEPDQRNNEADIVLSQNGASVTSQPGETRPWMTQLSPGDAHLEVSFQSFDTRFIDDTLFPPTYEWDPPV